MFNYPIGVKFLGNKRQAINALGFAKSQMNILENSMQFQNLKQASRRLSMPDGSVILCSKNYNIKSIEIFVPITIQAEESNIMTIKKNLLVIIYGNAEEWIKFHYNEDFITEFNDSEAVFCGDAGDDGSGLFTYRNETKLFGSFVKCWSSGVLIEGEDSGGKGVVEECQSRFYDRLYNNVEVFSSLLGAENENKFSSISFASPYDLSPLSNVSCKDAPTYRNVWSKTYDDFILTAYTFEPPLYPIVPLKWVVSLSYKDGIFQWEGSGNTYPSEGFTREVCSLGICTAFGTTTDTHMGFDIWGTEDPVSKEIIYYIGLLSEQEARVSQWIINITNKNISLQWEKSLSKEFGSIWSYLNKPKLHIRLLGYGFKEKTQKHYASWGLLNYDENQYYEDIIDLTGHVTSTLLTLSNNSGDTDLNIKTAIWNPISKELFFIWDRVIDTYLTQNLYTGNPILWVEKYCHSMCYLATGQLSEQITMDLIWGSATFTDVPVFQAIRPAFLDFEDYYTEHGVEFWSVDVTTKIRLNKQDIYVLGEYGVSTLEYNKGARGFTSMLDVFTDSFSKGTRPINSFPVQATAAGIGDMCEPLGMYDYAFVGGVFDIYGNITTKTNQYTYVQEAVPDSGLLLSCVIDHDLDKEINEGHPKTLAAIDTEFPYDHTWKSLLLKGTCRSSEQVGQAKIVKTGCVIYKDSNTNKLFTVLDTGDAYLVGDDGLYHRAFFKQIETTTEIGVEI